MPEREHRQVRRRRFLASSPQGPLLRKVYWLILVSVAVQSTLVYLIADRRLEAEYVRAHHTIATTLEGLLPWIVGASLIAILAALLGTLRLTLSVAGPTFRLRRHLRAVAGGDLTGRIRLRRDDQLHEIADEVNRLVEQLEDHIGRLQGCAVRLRETARGFVGGEAPSADEVGGLHDDIAALEEILADFRLRGDSGE
jgi:methyl-accepting chemotaxis protein